MKRATRWTRLPWVLGLALVTASLVGASHVLHSRPADAPARGEKSPAERPAYSNGLGVVCLGTVDLENGSYLNGGLAPVQPGEVTEVLVYEGQTVRKDDIILRVNDEPFVVQAAKAEVGVAIAEAQLAQARQGLERYQFLVAAQQSAVDAAQAKVKAAEAKLRRGRALQERGMANAEDIAAGEEEVNAYRAAQAAEEAKLREAQASKPDARIDEAAKNVELRKQDLRAAQIALKNCKLLAPADGTILRLTVGPGSVIGPQTRQAPVLFVPNGPRVVRAEVEQEWAHRIHLDQPAVIQDEANTSIAWQGKVKRLGDAFLPRRTAGDAVSLSNGPEPRYLECLVELAPSPNPPRLGQRVRVSLGPRNGLSQ